MIGILFAFGWCVKLYVHVCPSMCMCRYRGALRPLLQTPNQQPQPPQSNPIKNNALIIPITKKRRYDFKQNNPDGYKFNRLQANLLWGTGLILLAVAMYVVFACVCMCMHAGGKESTNPHRYMPEPPRQPQTPKQPKPTMNPGLTNPNTQTPKHTKTRYGPHTASAGVIPCMFVAPGAKCGSGWSATTKASGFHLPVCICVCIYMCVRVGVCV